MKKIINLGIASAAVVLLSGNAHSSALIEKDDSSKTITVIARIVYSGPALTKDIAKASTDEIQGMWSENPTDVVVGSTSYRVKFDIDYVMASGNKLKNDTSCAYNYITVLNKTDPGDRSYYAGLGSQNGVFYTSDDLGKSTTAAHEFGHGLMLDHNPGDQLEAKVPGIMFARGTLVAHQFQWDSNAAPGYPGGTINPKFRKVRSEDISAIPFSAVQTKLFKKVGCLGDGTARRIK